MGEKKAKAGNDRCPGFGRLDSTAPSADQYGELECRVGLGAGEDFVEIELKI